MVTDELSDVYDDKENEYRKEYEAGECVHIGLDGFLCHCEYFKRQSLEIRAVCVVTDDEIVKGQRKRHEKSGADARHNGREDDFKKRLKRSVTDKLL